MKTTIVSTNSTHRLLGRFALLLIPLLFSCIGLLPTVQAVSPAPDGGYPGANTAEGDNAMLNLTSGIANTAVGFNALADNTTGGWNVAIGSSALASNTAGSFNMAIGTDALTNSTANYNLAIGFRVGFMNTTGNHLTGIGAGALFSNTTGSFNTAIGSDALSSNTTGESNTANGQGALFSNTTGVLNTANGAGALSSNTTGFSNTATGVAALGANTTGVRNTAEGVGSLGGGISTGQTGNDNTAVGFFAMESNETGSLNTAIGDGALGGNSTGSNNIALGNAAGEQLTIGDNNIDIGNAGVERESNTIRIGLQGTQTATFIAGISGVTVAGGVGVIIDTSGHLGTVVSSERFKDEIKPMDRVSEAILSLKPVTFRYKHKLDPKGIPQFGLVAEEVEKVNPNLVARDEQGKPYSVRYEAVNAMLLNEFLKEHCKVEEQQAIIIELKSAVARQQKDFQATAARQQKQIETLTAGLQKVSDQLAAASPSGGRLEASESAPQTVCLPAVAPHESGNNSVKLSSIEARQFFQCQF